MLRRDEDPVGIWTIRVSDIGAKNRSGRFLGWELSLFGSTIDASIAREYEISLFDKLLPSLSSPTDPTDDHPSTTTKAHPKPTEHLPGNHGEAEGEADKPAFDNTDPADPASSSAVPSGTMVPTADEGWFTDMSKLVSNQKWVFGAAGLVLLFGLSAGFFLYRRAAAARRRRADRYSALPGEDLALGTLSRGSRGGPRTKELYDAFGEQGEDDEDDEPDENTALRSASPSRTDATIGFHEGFLDDEDVNTPHTAPQTPTAYRDEPDRGSAASPSGSGSGSGDGSWEHASETR